jgi:hypothetical protein
LAKNVLNGLNDATLVDKRDNKLGSMPQMDECVEPIISLIRGSNHDLKPRGVVRRHNVITLGYTTTYDFGTDGDDTIHFPILQYSRQTTSKKMLLSQPTEAPLPPLTYTVFLDYFTSTVVIILNQPGGDYTDDDVKYYLPPIYTTQSYLPAYAKKFWQANFPKCPVG